MRARYWLGVGLGLGSMLVCLQPLRAQERGATQPMELHTRLEPKVWPGNDLKDVRLYLTIKNTSRKPITLYPRYTDLSWRLSLANLGATWTLHFLPAEHDGAASGHELRTYYGPPGEPVSNEAMRDAAKVLKPGAQYEVMFHACWIPRKLLDPASLSLKVIDPDGFDNLKSLPKLADSSVLLFSAHSADVKRKLKNQQDFLRGNMVVFFSGSGKFSLKAEYAQGPVMYAVMEKLSVLAEPVEITLEK